METPTSIALYEWVINSVCDFLNQDPNHFRLAWNEDLRRWTITGFKSNNARKQLCYHCPSGKRHETIRDLPSFCLFYTRPEQLELYMICQTVAAACCSVMKQYPIPPAIKEWVATTSDIIVLDSLPMLPTSKKRKVEETKKDQKKEDEEKEEEPVPAEIAVVAESAKTLMGHYKQLFQKVDQVTKENRRLTQQLKEAKDKLAKVQDVVKLFASV